MAGFAPAPLPSLSLVLGDALALAADQGSLSITGQDASLLAGLVLTAEQGDYTIAGQDASFATGTPLYPGPLPHMALLGGFGGNQGVSDVGAYSVTGQDAGFLIGYRVTCDTGFYSLSGQAAIFNVSVAMSGDPAPLPHLGLLLAPASGSTTIVCDTGVYTITGSEGLADFEMSSAQGDYTITGQDAGLLKTNILVAESGAYDITGQDVVFSITSPDRFLGPESGVYSIAGQDAGLTSQYTVSAEQGFYALLGQAANLVVGVTNNYVMVAETGDYQVFGNDTNLTFGGYVLQPDVGYYSLDLQALYRAPTRRRAAPGRRYYTYKGKRYHVTLDELARLIRDDRIDITREDIVVEYNNKKPHKISKATFAQLAVISAELPELTEDDDEDIEAILALL